MSDEIKEAILYLEHTSKDDFNLEEHQKENRIWAIKVLLDYITNLQEENEKLLKKSYKDDVIITKAIEYLKEHSNNLMFELRIEEMEELLNILNGGDKE